jgi:SPP1 family predicted phage head-tail adaptor
MPDNAGGFGSDSTSDASVACRIAVPTGRERVVIDRLGLEADTTITVPHGTTVTETQRIEDQATGRTYEIALTNPEDSYRTATRCFCKRIG